MTAGRWQTNLIITLVVVFTVILGLLLSQLDFISLDAGNPTETAVAIITNTPDADPTETTLPTVAIPTETATPEDSATPSQPKSTNTPIPDGDMPCMAAPANWIEYTVKSGDTILSLSFTFGATQEELIQFNCLTSRTVSAGTTIFVPATPPTPVVCVVNPPASWRPYTVKRGDTMYSLARFRGVTVYNVLTVNCLSTTDLKAGQSIYLPAQITITLTPSPMPTATADPTLTPSPVPPSATPAPEETSTATPPPEPTATATGSQTPTATSTATASPSPTATSTGSATPTQTAVSTSTPTPIPTETPTVAPTATPTLVPTATPTIAPTNTLVPTSTPTNTPVP